MAKGLHRVASIHNPTLKGKPLLLLPEGLLVRWPDRVPVPAIGDGIEGTAVVVPMHLREAVMTVLFSPSPLARCDAAKRLAANKEHRKRILSRLFGRSLVQKMITSAERLDPEHRARIAALGDLVALRYVFKVAYSTTPKEGPEAAECAPQIANDSSGMDPQNHA